MSLNIAIQMDPIETIQIKGDSTFALMLEAQKRGHKLFYYTPDTLSCYENSIIATGYHLKSIQDVEGDHFQKAEKARVDLSQFDVVLLRQDPPFDMNYITTTHLLERIHPKTLVVNDPSSVRNAPEKLFILDFADLMPPTLITRNEFEVKKFRKEYKDIIIKPLYGNGGAGVFRLTPQDNNISSLIEMFLEMYREPFIVQQYLPDVRKGDKRIILVDGEIAGAVNRVPAENETRSNMHVGGKPVKVDLTPRDIEICERLRPALKERGLIFTGIDVIGDVMTEINVTSPTGIREISNFGGNDIAAMIWNAIEQKISHS